MNNTILKKRLSVLKIALKEQDVDAIIITDPANVRYLTGFTGDDSWAVVSGGVYLITDSRYTEQAKKECGCKVIERKKTLPQEAGKLLAGLKKTATVAVEDTIQIRVLKAVKKNIKIKIKPVLGLVEKIRTVKDDYETDCIKKAAKIAFAALAETIKKAKPGITETELAATLDFNIKKRGSTNGFNTIVAFGANASMPHYHPGSRKLKKNDTVLIDFGATYQGYTCDITRCFAVGRAAREYIRVYNAVLEAQKAAISVLKAGVEVAEVEQAARKILEKYNLPQYGHGTGHGIGLNVHELPIVSARIKSGQLTAGHIVTIEPAVYIPDKLGVRIEDNALITQNGCKLLTPQEFKDNFKKT